MPQLPRIGVFVLGWAGFLVSTIPAGAALVPVTTTAQLLTAVNSAQPGDVITLAPGTYELSQTLYCDTPGTASQPITVQALVLGTAKIRSNTVEAFRISAPYWDFENLDVQGVCASDSDCEHAFHIGGGGDFTRIRNSRLHDFNAEIKGNGDSTPPVFPNGVLIEGNELFDSAPRQTSNPVSPIDVVGGDGWVVRGNFIHDHAKAQGDQISYAGFLKGNSRNGIFERNLVICERDTTGFIRLGLSFGGGGTSPESICEDGTCTPEHQNGIMRNNIIVNCPADVGIYLNKAQNAGIYNNTIYNSTGIDVRFTASTVDLRDNLLSGAIRNRDGGTSTQGSNLTGITGAVVRLVREPRHRQLRAARRLPDRQPRPAAGAGDRRLLRQAAQRRRPGPRSGRVRWDRDLRHHQARRRRWGRRRNGAPPRRLRVGRYVGVDGGAVKTSLQS